MGGSLIAFRLGLVWLIAYGTFVNSLMFAVGLSQIEVFGSVILVGTLVYSANFYLTDLLEEHYGIGKAREFVWVILGTQLGLIGMVTLVLQMQPAASDTLLPAILQIVTPWYPVMIISIINNFVLQYFDTWLFGWIKRQTKGRWLWLRNNGSTMTTMALDSFIALPIAVHLAFPDLSLSVLLSLSISAVTIKFLIALFDTPFIYLSRRFKPKELQS